jgi:glycosyltransferase involved in cell wall biosynthesis
MAASRRVLHVINGEFYAGAERVQDHLAMQLPQTGFDIGFASLIDGVFAAKRESQQSPLYQLSMASRIDLRPARKLAALIREDGFQLVHTHTPRAAMLGRLASVWAGVPMVHHVHSPASEDTEQALRNMRNNMVERISFLGVRKLIPVSRSLEQRLLRQGFRASMLHCVCNGVPLQSLQRRDYMAGEPLVIGMVALFRPRKGLEVLLRALANLQAMGREVRLRAVGPFETAEYELEIKNLTRQLELDDSVTWVGFSNDVAAEYRRMHVFVLPSLFGEGMPMVVLEAMAAGLPLVSTRVEGIPEVVCDGREGLLVEPGDVGQMTAAIAKLMSPEVDLRALGDAARMRQRLEFSDESMAAGVASVYREVLGD